MEVGSDVQAKIDQLAKLPKAARLGILAGLCVAIGAGYYFMYYQGARDELRQLRSQELDLQRKLSEVRSVAANIAAFEEDEKGSITPGKLADITVLSQDLLTVPEQAIMDTRIVMTILGGRVRYRDGEIVQ